MRIQFEYVTLSYRFSVKRLVIRQLVNCHDLASAGKGHLTGRHLVELIRILRSRPQGLDPPGIR